MGICAMERYVLEIEKGQGTIANVWNIVEMGIADHPALYEVDGGWREDFWR